MHDNLKSAIMADMEDYQRADHDRIGAAIACGQKLKLAKDDIAHGHWLPFIESINLPGRTATRWMQIAHYDTDSVRKAGGITKAAEFESDYPTDKAKARAILDGLNSLFEQMQGLAKLYPIIERLDKAMAGRMVDCLNESQQAFASACSLLLTDEQIAELNAEFKA